MVGEIVGWSEKSGAQEGARVGATSIFTRRAGRTTCSRTDS